MKTLDELKEFYTNELSADLRRLEARRQQVIRNAMIAAGVLAVLGLIAFGAIAPRMRPPMRKKVNEVII